MTSTAVRDNTPLPLRGDDERLDELINVHGMCQLAATGPQRPTPRAVAAPVRPLAHPDQEVAMKKHALYLALATAAWTAAVAGVLVYAERKAAEAAGWLL